MSEYSYPANRVSRPEDVEDLGEFPDELRMPAKKVNPLAALAKKQPQVATPPPQDPTADSRRVSEAPVPEPSAQPTARSTSTKPQRGSGSRASTCLLPIPLIDKVTAHRSETDLSAGSIFVEAIEATYGQLADLLREERARTATGFTTREVVHAEKGATALMPYRLSGADFDNLDRVVKELGAKNRTHLILTALTAYFKDM